MFIKVSGIKLFGCSDTSLPSSKCRRVLASGLGGLNKWSQEVRIWRSVNRSLVYSAIIRLLLLCTQLCYLNKIVMYFSVVWYFPELIVNKYITMHRSYSASSLVSLLTPARGRGICFPCVMELFSKNSKYTLWVSTKNLNLITIKMFTFLKCSWGLKSYLVGVIINDNRNVFFYLTNKCSTCRSCSLTSYCKKSSISFKKPTKLPVTLLYHIASTTPVVHAIGWWKLAIWEKH